MPSQVQAIPTFPMKRDPNRPLDPPPELMQLHDEARIRRVRIWDGSTPWLITRYQDARDMLASRKVSSNNLLPGYPRENEAFSRVREMYRSFVNMDPPDHTRYRRMLTRDFTIKAIESLRPRVQATVDDLVTEMLALNPPVNFVDEFALALPSRLICTLLGVPYEDHDFFQSRAKTMASNHSTAEEAEQASTELVSRYLGELVDAKIEEPTDDILGRLIAQHYTAGEVSRDEVVSIARLLLVAGHDTTGNMTALGTLTLLRHRDQFEKIRKEPSSVANAVEELLRYLHIAHTGTSRVALEDIEIGEATIRAGDGIIISTISGDRDSAVFERPQELNLDRENARQHLAFGYGVHQCLGQHLARLELQVVFGTLFERVPTLKLVDKFDEIDFKEEMLNYGVDALWVEW